MEGSDGFSLLELLLALVVLGMLSVGIASTMSVGRSVWERAGNADTAGYALFRNRVRLLLENAPNPVVKDQAGRVLAGGPLEVEFLSFPAGDRYWRGEPVLITFSLITDDNGIRLKLREEGISSKDRASTASEVVFEEQFYQVKLSYFGRTMGNGEREWTDSWNSKQSLPELFRLELTGKDGFVHPPLIVIPAKDARQSLISASSPLPPG